MSWWAIDVRPAPERREWLGAWLVARTGQAVEELDDGTLVTFAEDGPAADALLAEIRGACERVEAARRPLPRVDWASRWRDGLAPRRIGRLTVVPSWLPEAVQPGPSTVVLDPETAFGSGEHNSTRTALALLERLLRPADRVLDLGSGSGILAIAAVKLGAARATGIESDPDANPVALRNAARNGVADRVTFLEGKAADLMPLMGPADLILSNILRSVNAALLPDIAGALRPGGAAILAGMEESEAAEFVPALDAVGFTIVDQAVDDGWWAVAAHRP